MSDNPAQLIPTDIGGYEVVDELTEACCYRAIAPGGRHVVLKMLDADLITRGQLHPNVRDRMGRVREIAHLGIANLYGAERDSGQAYLIWEYVDGTSLMDWCSQADRSPRDLLLTARELVLAVESLHARGVVHGAIHSRNVIITPTGRVKLTHISPYLYVDPAVDAAAIVEILREIITNSGLEEHPLSGLLPADDQQPVESLRLLGSRLTSLIEMRQRPAPVESEVRLEHRHRRRSFLGALSVVVLGLLMAYGVRRLVGASTSAAPAPPQANAAAMTAISHR